MRNSVNKKYVSAKFVRITCAIYADKQNVKCVFSTKTTKRMKCYGIIYPTLSFKLICQVTLKYNKLRTSLELVKSISSECTKV